VVLVAIDDRTFNSVQEWPFARGLHARVIDHLARAGAKAIAYDVQFTEPSGRPAQDNQLIESVRRAGNVVLATTEIQNDGSTRIFGGGEGLAYSRGHPAWALFPNDPGGVIRRMDFDMSGLRSFPVEAATVLRGTRPALPSGRTAWIDFPGPAGTVRTLSFGDVLNGHFDPAVVRGKVVVVGATAPSLQDLHATSTTGLDKMPGPEIQADAIQTVLDGFPLAPAPAIVEVALILLLGLAAPLLAIRLSPMVALGVTLGLAVLVAVGAQLAFDRGLILSVVYAGIAGLLSCVATGAIEGMSTAYERERVRDTFARFVPESVVGQVLSQADGLRLGGVRVEATLMFTDLRGFTTFSERRDPDLVISVLNRYLSQMSDAILDHGGTLVSFMGDGIMAVFGAPLGQADHPDRALATGRDMLARLERLNEELRAEGNGDGFKMGIGLNTGWVMSGNVGSERRLEYTAIGDTTNTAARIEGMTKGTPYSLFLADSTYAQLTGDTVDLVAIGDMEVRGRGSKIRLWALDVPSPAPSTGPEPGSALEPATPGA
jgi:adenylate cyclase